VDWLVAVQAQDFAGAKWALGLRMREATDEGIEKAFNQGAILRTHLMRPTWHFVTPVDIRWLLALTAPRVHIANASMYRRLELDNAIFNRSNYAMANALQGGKQLTREELRSVLSQVGIEAGDGQRMAYLLMDAELEGVICSGARRGKQFTYALLEDRAPPEKALERQVALAEFARRYFLSRGPASVQDFAKWSGLTIAEARDGLEAVKTQFENEMLDGQTYWFSATGPPSSAASPSAHLLSIYDEYVSAYKDRGAIIDENHGARLWEMGNALSYIIVLDGQVLGTWRRTLRRTEVAIELNPFERLSAAEERAVDSAAGRYGAFLGLPVVFV
jgi:hypothetical protein